MDVTIVFEDSGHTYSVDFFKLAKHLNITEEEIRQAVYKVMATV